MLIQKSVDYRLGRQVISVILFSGYGPTDQPTNGPRDKASGSVSLPPVDRKFILFSDWIEN